jgi:hypothetical protein
MQGMGIGALYLPGGFIPQFIIATTDESIVGHFDGGCTRGLGITMETINPNVNHSHAPPPVTFNGVTWNHVARFTKYGGTTYGRFEDQWILCAPWGDFDSGGYALQSYVCMNVFVSGK